LLHAKVTQLTFAGSQATGDLAQRARSAERTERHRHELAPAGHAFGVFSPWWHDTASSNSPRGTSLTT
jgi:hypothetical protein